MYWLAFTTGLLGSLHCVGMCGPIALALPTSNNGKSAILKNAALYNLGRTVTYMLLGVLVGVIGEGLSLAGIQQSLSILLGVLILLIVIFSWNFEKWLLQIPLFSQLFFQLKYRLATFLNRPSSNAIFLTGLLNGLLPCGLVYVALAGALATTSVQASAGYMLLFGIGTIPLLFMTIIIGNRTTLPFKSLLHKAQPLLLTALGVWLIYRGTYMYLPDRIYLSDILSALPMCY